MPEELQQWTVTGLWDRRRTLFQVCALAGECLSEWTCRVETVPGAVGAALLFSMMPGISIWSLVRMVVYSLAAVLRARLGW